MNAHDIVYQARRKGLLVPKPCERCGAARVEGHHEDYDKPLEVVWLCRKCHTKRHSELQPARWADEMKVRVTPKMKREVERLARRRMSTVSRIVREAIQEFLAK